MEDKGDKNQAKTSPLEYFCNICDYKTCKKSNFNMHKTTTKHIKRTKEDEIKQKLAKTSKIIKNTEKQLFICICGNEYKHRQGLWKHKKICKNEESNISLDKKNDINDNFLELLKQNQEFKELISEQNKIIMELAKNTGNNITNTNTNINNCNNKTFNLQFFLNEKCKDALNINEFIDSLKISFSDLENIGENGFVNGISKIFVNGLKSLDIYKRPIHCSDLKRETMYLKEDNVWEKDSDNKERLKKTVKLIAHKNMLKINDWKKENPQYKNSESKKNDQYLKMLISTAGPTNKEDEISHYEKIISNIAKEVTIDKQI